MTEQIERELVDVTISRSGWSHGDLLRNALLVTQDLLDQAKRDVVEYGEPGAGKLPALGQKCCLGFGCNALGVTDDMLQGILGMPESLKGVAKDLVADRMLGDHKYGHQAWVNDAQVVNDAMIGVRVELNTYQPNKFDEQVEIESEDHREYLIQRLFYKGGMIVRFVD